MFFNIDIKIYIPGNFFGFLKGIKPALSYKARGAPNIKPRASNPII